MVTKSCQKFHHSIVVSLKFHQLLPQFLLICSIICWVHILLAENIQGVENI